MPSLLHSHKVLNKMSIGVIGMGVIGTAFYEGMKHAHDVFTYDKFKSESSNLLMMCKLENAIGTMVTSVHGPIFISVPTPMNVDGSCNTTIVEDVCKELNDAAGQFGYKKIVVIRSTVPPGTTQKLSEKYPLLSFVFNPEFLTEANAFEDFKNQTRIILGGDLDATASVEEVYHFAYPNTPIHRCRSIEAEMIKYMANCFLATKVSFANEMYQICDKIGARYDKVVELATLDKRLGTSHWQVPGPDGHFGFGLTCFPKDINALITLSEQLGIEPKILKAAWEKNLKVRPEKDWEQLKGRAVL